MEGFDRMAIRNAERKSMKKSLLSVVLLICFTVPAFGAQFVEIGKDETHEVYVDIDSIESRDDHIVVWVKIVPHGEQKIEVETQYETAVSHALALVALNRIFRQMQFLSYVVYDENDNAMESDSFPFVPDEYQEIPPDTVISQIYDFVMLYYHTALESPRIRME